MKEESLVPSAIERVALAERTLLNSSFRAALLLALCAGAFGQLPDAPSHKLFDDKNVVTISLLTGFVAADGITTQVLISSGAREWNPVARPFVTRGAGGQTVACGIGLGASLGTAYVLHKTGHHKMEWFALHLSLGIEGAMATGNTLEILKRPTR